MLFTDLKPNVKKGVVIHHWDTDGLTSAALLLNYFAQRYPTIQLDPFVPVVGNYYLTDDQYHYLQQQGYQFAITCDINFPATTVQRLADLFPGQVYMIDHHKQAPYTQVHYFNEPYPACSAYVNYLLEQPTNLVAVLGLVGDKEELIQQDQQFYPLVQTMMAEHNLTFGQLLDLRRLIDSNYIMNDYAGMLETIELLRTDPLALFNDVRLQSHHQTIIDELDRLLAKSLTVISPLVQELQVDTRLHVLSHLTRILSRQYPDKVIFTYQNQGEQYTCYVRRRQVNYDMGQMITYARSLGLNAGGKDDVVGIIVPTSRWAEIFPQLEAKLKTIA